MRKAFLLIPFLFTVISCQNNTKIKKEGSALKNLRVDSKYITNDIDDLLNNLHQVDYLSLIYERPFEKISERFVNNNKVITDYRFDTLNQYLAFELNDQINLEDFYYSTSSFLLHCIKSRKYKRLIYSIFGDITYIKSQEKTQEIIQDFMSLSEDKKSILINVKDRKKNVQEFLSKAEFIIRKTCVTGFSKLPCGTGEYEIISEDLSSSIILQLKEGISSNSGYQQIEITNFGRNEFALKSFLEGGLDVLLHYPLEDRNKLLEGIYERNENIYGKYEMIELNKSRSAWVLLNENLELNRRQEVLREIQSRLAINETLNVLMPFEDLVSTGREDFSRSDSIFANIKIARESENEIFEEIFKQHFNTAFISSTVLNRNDLIHKYRNGEIDLAFISFEEDGIDELLEHELFPGLEAEVSGEYLDSLIIEFNSNFAFYSSFRYEHSPIIIQPYVTISEQIDTKSDIFVNSNIEEIETLMPNNL